MADFETANWYLYMEPGMRALSKLSFDLLEREKAAPNAGATLPDYGFIVFPMAKAYEGFLKRMFYDLELITKQQYMGEHFRIGKALNPSLPTRYRHGWVYEKLVAYCDGDALPQTLWQAWTKARNRVFHFFPQYTDILPLADAEDLLILLTGAMEKAVAGCDLKH